MRPFRCAVAIICALALAGCAVAPPTGPDVMVLPGKDKSFEAFQADDAACRQYASAQIGYASPAEAATESGVGSAALGTVLGGAAGAAIGAAAGNPAAGAAIGAGTGLVTGGAAGIGAAQASGMSLQQRYDMGYVQCMSAKGENVPAASASYPVYPYYPPYYAYYPPYYPYDPPYYGPAFFGFGASFGFHGHGGHRGHHFHHSQHSSRSHHSHH
jgi:outer membrane lipoprotein SlyB